MVFSWVVAGLQQLEQSVRDHRSNIDAYVPYGVVVLALMMLFLAKHIIVRVIAIAILVQLWVTMHAEPVDLESRKPDPVDGDSGSEHAEATG